MVYPCASCDKKTDVVRVETEEGKAFMCLSCATAEDLYCLWHQQGKTCYIERHACLLCVDATVEALGPDLAREWTNALQDQFEVAVFKKIKQYATDLGIIRPNLSTDMRVVWGIVFFAQKHHSRPERIFREVLLSKSPERVLSKPPETS